MLGEPFQTRARSAVTPPGQIAVRSGVVEFVDAIVRGSADVAIIDPTLAGWNLTVSSSLVSAHVGTVLYISLTPEYAQAAVRMIRALGSGEVVTFGYSDDPVTFAGILRRQSRASRQEYLLRALEPQLSKLPAGIRSGIAAIAEQGDRIDSVDSLASLCGVTRSTLWRRLRNVGVGSAWGFVAGMALLRNYDSLTARNLTVRDIAHALGLRSTRALHRQCAVVASTSLRDIRAPMSIETLAANIAATLTSLAASPPRRMAPRLRPDQTQRRRSRQSVRAPDYRP